MANGCVVEEPELVRLVSHGSTFSILMVNDRSISIIAWVFSRRDMVVVVAVFVAPVEVMVVVP